VSALACFGLGGAHLVYLTHLEERRFDWVDIAVRQKGSHLTIRCGICQSVVPVHAGEDLKQGTLRSIERSLEPCLGKGWLKR
jgi:hypothetical protein